MLSDCGLLRCRSLYATQYCVRTWDAGVRTLGKYILQIQVEVFHTVAAAAEHGEYGPYNLAVLIACQRTAKPQVGVDYRGQNTVKFVQNEKYSVKSADFFRFLLYLCNVIDDFACLDFAALR